MRRNKSPLRGSVTQNSVSIRIRANNQAGISFLARLSILVGVIIITIVAAWASWRNGWPQRLAEQTVNVVMVLTQKAHFAVNDIVVTGRHQSSKDEIYDALGSERGAPILAIDTAAAAARISKLSWIESVTVERHLPDTVMVILNERQPMARWQHDDHIYVIDSEGHVLPTAQPQDFSRLPLVVGTGAEREAQTILSALKGYPDISQKTEAMVRVGERRWDLHLTPKVTVRLPEDDVENALHRLSVLITQERILDRDIVAIDLRLPDRLVIEPTTNKQPVGEIKQ